LIGQQPILIRHRLIFIRGQAGAVCAGNTRFLDYSVALSQDTLAQSLLMSLQGRFAVAKVAAGCLK
jgi:hypothetical protein